MILSVPKFTANLYCICLSITQIYTSADAVQISGKFWDTQYHGTIIYYEYHAVNKEAANTQKKVINNKPEFCLKAAVHTVRAFSKLKLTPELQAHIPVPSILRIVDGHSEIFTHIKIKLCYSGC